MKAFLRHTLLITSLAALIPASQANTLPIFDSHSHYSLADSRVLSPAQIISRYDKYNVIGAVISSTPTSKAELLYQHAPKRIIPFLSLYKPKPTNPTGCWTSIP